MRRSPCTLSAHTRRPASGPYRASASSRDPTRASRHRDPTGASRGPTRAAVRRALGSPAPSPFLPSARSCTWGRGRPGAGAGCQVQGTCPSTSQHKRKGGCLYPANLPRAEVFLVLVFGDSCQHSRETSTPGAPLFPCSREPTNPGASRVPPSACGGRGRVNVLRIGLVHLRCAPSLGRGRGWWKEVEHGQVSGQGTGVQNGQGHQGSQRRPQLGSPRAHRSLSPPEHSQGPRPWLCSRLRRARHRNALPQRNERPTTSSSPPSTWPG